MSAAPGDSIAGDVRRGLVWSSLNSLSLRLGNLVVGVFLARLLVPADFGVYAIALTVQTILMTLADLGMSTDLIRADDPARRAPTVATLSLTSSVVAALGMSLTAQPLAELTMTPDATWVIIALSWTLVIAGAGVVPYAKLQRDFAQGKLFACSAVDFAVGTVTTVALVLLGMGPMALAIGRGVAQAASTSLQFVLSGLRPSFGFDIRVARSALGFGLPLAGANLLSWALLNIDNVVIARVAGAASLGLYVLAFNVSSWPMNAIGYAVRQVSLAGFSRTAKRETDDSLETALSLTWAVALPVGVLLAALAHPLVELLYGERWSSSAVVLGALGIFGALRVAFDLFATYLMAKGAARPVLYVQVLWFVSLIPGVVLGTHWKGIAGAGWAHLVIGVAIVLPAYAVALRHVGVRLRPVLAAMWRPAAAAVPTWCIAHAAVTHFRAPLLGLFFGGAVASLVYVAICFRWFRGLLPDKEPHREPIATHPIDQPQLEGVA
jgi:PST family polysaccharide transporter